MKKNKDLKEFVKHKSTNKELLHLSFFDASGRLRVEYIPDLERKYIRDLKIHYVTLISRHGLGNIYYWHIRPFLYPYDRKIEDLRFIHHVKADHGGSPKNLREWYFFRKLWYLYGIEYEQLAKRIFERQDGGYVIYEPYEKAYVKSWRLDRSAQWKVLYHGVESENYINVLSQLIDENKRNLNTLISAEKRKSRKSPTLTK